MSKNKYYNQNYTWNDISKILEKIRKCIKKDCYIISLNSNRLENKSFLEQYRIDKKKRKKILLDISVEDFCHSLQNKKIAFRNETLYVFVPNVELINMSGYRELVSIYVKFNLILNAKNKSVVVISFHKLNKKISYLFKNK